MRVGREQHRDECRAVVRTWVRGAIGGEGGGACLLVEGEPGAGRTSFLREALADAAALGCRVRYGAAESLGAGLPLRAALDCLHPSGPGRARALALLREAARSAEPGGALLAAVDLLAADVEEWCARRPLLLALDDLQWADPATLLLWRHLARAAQRLPLLLLTARRRLPRRPEVEELCASLGGGPGGRTLRLEPLTGAESAALVREVLGAAPGPRLREAAGHAGGNPRLLRELLAHWSALIEVRADQAELTLPVADLPPPPESATRELGRLPRAAVATLRQAALLGPAFTARELALVRSLPVRDLLADLETPLVTGVLEPAALPAGLPAPGGDALRFRQPAVRLALYAELPRAARSALHQDAARAFAAADLDPTRTAAQLLAGGALEPWAVRWTAESARALITASPETAAALLSRAVEQSAAQDAERGVDPGQDQDPAPERGPARDAAQNPGQDPEHGPEQAPERDAEQSAEPEQEPAQGPGWSAGQDAESAAQTARRGTERAPGRPQAHDAGPRSSPSDPAGPAMPGTMPGHTAEATPYAPYANAPTAHPDPAPDAADSPDATRRSRPDRERRADRTPDRPGSQYREALEDGLAEAALMLRRPESVELIRTLRERAQDPARRTALAFKLVSALMIQGDMAQSLEITEEALAEAALAEEAKAGAAGAVPAEKALTAGATAEAAPARTATGKAVLAGPAAASAVTAEEGLAGEATAEAALAGPATAAVGTTGAASAGPWTAGAAATAEGPGAEEPRAEEPRAEGPGGKGPGGKGPGAEEPRAEGPGGKGPGGKGPGGKGPGAEGPGGNGPGAEEPGGNGPGAEEPGGNGPGGVMRLRLEACRVLALADLHRPEEAYALAGPLVERARLLGDPLCGAEAEHAMSFALFHLNRGRESLRHVAAGIAHARRSPAANDMRLLLLANQAEGHLRFDEPHSAAAALREARELAARTGSTGRLVVTEVLLADLRYRLGDWDAALAGLARAEGMPVSDAWLPVLTRGLRALILGHRGEQSSARAELAALGPAAYEPPAARRHTAQVLLARALLAERDGSPRAALEALLPALEDGVDEAVAFDRPWALSEAVRLALEDRDTGTARSALAACARTAAALPEQPGPALALLRSRGLFAQDPELLVEAAALARGGLVAGQTLEDLAVARAWHGDLPAARSALTGAVASYELLGARWDIARADARLRSLGVRRGSRAARRRPARGWQALTPAELKVALLVARGRTNPEIASALFLSRRTVQTHVSHILAKLEVRSRAEVAVVVAGQEGAQGPQRVVRTGLDRAGRYAERLGGLADAGPAEVDLEEDGPVIGAE